MFENITAVNVCKSDCVNLKKKQEHFKNWGEGGGGDVSCYFVQQADKNKYISVKCFKIIDP